MDTFDKAGAVWVGGSAITLALAFLLFERGYAAAAIALIILSPFPCPSGLPC